MKIPKAEKVWLTQTMQNGNIYIVTSDELRTTYKLYKYINNNYEYTKHKDSTPAGLNKYME